MGSLSCSIIVSAGDAAPRSLHCPTEPCGGSQCVPPRCQGSWPWHGLAAWCHPLTGGEDMGTCCGAGWVAPRVAHACLCPPRNLLDMDTFSKSDPGGWWDRAGGTARAQHGMARQPSSAPLSAVVVLFVQGSGSSEWKEVSAAPLARSLGKLPAPCRGCCCPQCPHSWLIPGGVKWAHMATHVHANDPSASTLMIPPCPR